MGLYSSTSLALRASIQKKLNGEFATQTNITELWESAPKCGGQVLTAKLAEGQARRLLTSLEGMRKLPQRLAVELGFKSPYGA